MPLALFRVEIGKNGAVYGISALSNVSDLDFERGNDEIMQQLRGGFVPLDA